MTNGSFTGSARYYTLLDTGLKSTRSPIFYFEYQRKSHLYSLLQWVSTQRCFEKHGQEENNPLQEVVCWSTCSSRLHVCCSEHLGSLIRWLFVLVFLPSSSWTRDLTGEFPRGIWSHRLHTSPSLHSFSSIPPSSYSTYESVGVMKD